MLFVLFEGLNPNSISSFVLKILFVPGFKILNLTEVYPTKFLLFGYLGIHSFNKSLSFKSKFSFLFCFSYNKYNSPDLFLNILSSLKLKGSLNWYLYKIESFSLILSYLIFSSFFSYFSS